MIRRPDILLVVADCARSDKYFGPGRVAVTPNLDRLARDGASFPTTITEKSCTTPSFATLLTGLHSLRHGVHLVWGYRLGERVPMLTKVLAEEGYHTYAEVTGPLLPETGLDRGFDSYEYRAPCDYLHTTWGDQFIQHLRAGHYRRPWFIMLHLWELHEPRQVAPKHDRPEFGRDAYERSVSSLDDQLGPVFDAVGDDAMIIFTGDHGQKTSMETYREGTAVAYARDLLGVNEATGMQPSAMAAWAGPSVLQQFYGQCAPLMKHVRLRGANNRPGFGRWARLRDRLRLLPVTPMLFLWDFLALGAPVRLTNMLKRRGLLNADRAHNKVNRLSRLFDARQLLDMHMRMWINGYKTSMREGHLIHVYDFLVKVPLVIRWPAGLPRSAVFGQMVREPDIMPTVFDLMGIDRSRFGDIDGQSFAPLIRGEAWQPQPAYLSLTGCPADLELRGVRTEDSKYTYGPENPELPEELYDLTRDPAESHNLAAEQPERSAQLRELADRFVLAGQQAPIEMMTIDPDQQQSIEKRLQELGYLD